MFIQVVIYGLLSILLIACAETQSVTAPVAVVEKERLASSGVQNLGKGVYKVGEPYQIRGIWYCPYENYGYRETGMASWYGVDFHGKKTANGARFDMNTLTAAHRTLPMPSMVCVTNLINGRALTVQVNDRGPFVNDRIIDLSRRAAQLLGFEGQGTTWVRVEILTEESLVLKRQLLQARTTIAAANQKGVHQAAPGPPLSPLLPSPLGAGAPWGSTIASCSAVQTLSATESTEEPVLSRTSGYYIQAAAFSNSKLAYSACKQLKQVGYVTLVPQIQNDRILYRLHIGPLAERAAAERLLIGVHQAGYTDAWIVGKKSTSGNADCS
ncbi:Rare lipoprotein A precursor [invertebrate metagenome]|uniref:Rare lipoprotein A n=1 Tax=invertebrate metagenome TaxID=1711999 RepID=A0A484H752_9ZZZZ